jgi:hypothetical protein
MYPRRRSLPMATRRKMTTVIEGGRDGQAIELNH